MSGDGSLDDVPDRTGLARQAAGFQVVSRLAGQAISPVVKPWTGVSMDPLELDVAANTHDLDASQGGSVGNVSALATGQQPQRCL